MLKNILPPTTKRVTLHTDEKINKKIQDKTLRNIEYYKNGNNEEIIHRIRALDKEWDIERSLETNASIIILLSAFLGLRTKRKCWFMTTGIVSSFLLQHALQGWCPPISLFRSMGIRTSEEINLEKQILKCFIK